MSSIKDWNLKDHITLLKHGKPDCSYSLYVAERFDLRCLEYRIVISRGLRTSLKYYTKNGNGKRYRKYYYVFVRLMHFTGVSRIGDEDVTTKYPAIIEIITIIITAETINLSSVESGAYLELYFGGGGEEEEGAGKSIQSSQS